MHSANHALISIAEEIRKTLGNNEFSCDVFLSFQKTFDTVYHKILVNKLHYYEARGITFN